MSDRFPFTSFPRGWYRVADSRALARGRVMAVRAFDQELVLTRGADGKARLFDAHCPHLGAHLGHGGKVVGDLLECPFHGWRFDGQGRCVSLPLTNMIPERAHLRAWPVDEVNDVVLAWFDPRGSAPDWAMPELPERSLSDWTAFRPAKHWTICTHVQEIFENAIDTTHFSHLHYQQTKHTESRGLEINGPRLTHRSNQHHNIFGVGQRLNRHGHGTLETTCYALGCGVNRVRCRQGISLDYCVVFYLLPIDRNRIVVHSYYAMRRKGLLTLPLLYFAMYGGRRTVDQDMPIWENKIYRPRPRLSDADGPIMQFRKWARQFYDSNEPAREPAKTFEADCGENNALADR